MIQSGGIIRGIPIFENISDQTEQQSVSKEQIQLEILDKQIGKFNKEYITGKSLKITLTNKETKYIVKVIRKQKNFIKKNPVKTTQI